MGTEAYLHTPGIIRLQEEQVMEVRNTCAPERRRSTTAHHGRRTSWWRNLRRGRRTRIPSRKSNINRRAQSRLRLVPSTVLTVLPAVSGFGACSCYKSERW